MSERPRIRSAAEQQRVLAEIVKRDFGPADDPAAAIEAKVAAVEAAMDGLGQVVTMARIGPSRH